MKLAWRQLFPFPLALLAFAAIGVKYFGIVFTTGTRWAFLALLLAFLIPHARILSRFKNQFGWVLIFYFIWCTGTTLWSLVPNLSLLKSTALVLTVVAFLSGGYIWSTIVPTQRVFAYVIPVVLLAVVATLGGRGRGETSQGIRLYEGLTANPNLLGILAAISFQWVLYRLYLTFHRRSTVHMRIFSVGLAAILCVSLLLASSRASLLCFFFTTFFAAMALATNKKAIGVLVLSFSVVGALLIFPQIETSLYHHYILKGGEKGEIFYSRSGPWEVSYEAALKGGFFGAGYGASVGDDTFNLSLTADTYGREKGNSQLAIWEETGIFGLVLYAVLMFGILREVYRGLRAARFDEDLRMTLAISFGFIVGITAQSAFEAWWTAPGSIESAAFWSAVGVAVGLARKAQAMRKRRPPATYLTIPIGPHPLYGRPALPIGHERERQGRR